MLLLMRILAFLCSHFWNQFTNLAKCVIILWSLSWLLMKIYSVYFDHATWLTRFDLK